MSLVSHVTDVLRTVVVVVYFTIAFHYFLCSELRSAKYAYSKRKERGAKFKLFFVSAASARLSSERGLCVP